MRRDGTGLGVGERPERHLGAVPALRPARVAVEVPIEAKLHAPVPRPEWLERRELIDQLARSVVKLVLVDAPAGFGKTTLVAQWRSSPAESRPFAWVSLDRGDDDPGRLWWYIVSALARACPEFDGEALAGELQTRAPDVAGTVLPQLVNDLAGLPGPAVLVLDDYHLIKDRRCHEQVAFLLAHLPPAMQVVLLTRADPPLQLARLRAAGEMVEIRARELQFTSEDAAALVNAVADMRLDQTDLADLLDRTEGWAAGVYLAALSLRGHSAPHEFVRQFTGDHRFIVDFLAEEVLSRQPDEISKFLMRTSLLARFCAPLADAVTGGDGGAQIIETLERENLFLVPLDDHRGWYRYHQLFAHVLRSQLARAESDLEPALHERASAWHEQSGSTEEAVRHALAAGDAARAVDLIARHWLAYVGIGWTATVHGWMRLLGDHQIAANPLAAHCAAWVAALTGDRETLRRWLPAIEAGSYEGPLPDGIRSLRSSAALLRAVFGFDGLAVMRESAALAAKIESDQASPYYALARATLGISLYLTGEPAAAAAPLEEAVQAKASVPLIHMLALSYQSLVATKLGRLSKARDLAQEACALAARGDLGKAPQAWSAYAAMGAVCAAQGQLEEAKSEHEHALRLRRMAPGITPWATVETVLLLAPILLDLGDQDGAAELADEVRGVLAVLPDGTDALRARLAELDRRLAARPRPGSLAEPLTEREMAVLRLLGGSLSQREIGRELFVSTNTIKTHTQTIYRKLGVSTRHDAVALGKQLGILCVRPCALPE